MNCHRVHQLVSPYLDHQLTGAEMLEIQRHLEGCRSCTKEYQDARHIKSLLRSLRVQEPVSPLETRIARRLTQEDRALGWALLAGTVPSREALLPPLSLLARPQRGRRLAVALALSCVALFAITPSFAPPAADVAATRATAPGGLGQTAFREQTPGAFGPVTPGTLSLLLAHSDAGGGPSLSPAVWGMDAGSQDVRAPIPYAPPLVDVGAEPLGDPAADGYIALADYHPH